MTVTTKDDEQNFFICGQCKTKIFYLKSEEPPDICPECDVNVAITGTGRNPGSAVGQPNDGETADAALIIRSRGWEHGKKNKDSVPSKIKLDLNQY